MNTRELARTTYFDNMAAFGKAKSNSYEMIPWWSDEGAAYVVDVPELPGCMAHGPTRQDAIRNAEDAIKFWIKTAKEDGITIPIPRGRLVYA